MCQTWNKVILESGAPSGDGNSETSQFIRLNVEDVENVKDGGQL